MLAAAGNQAIARLAATERGRRALGAGRSVRGPDGRLLQRVGEEKFSYTESKDAPKESVALLNAAIAEVRKTRKEAKDKFETETLTKLPTKTETERKDIVMDKYVAVLTVGEIATALGTTEPFKSGKLTLTGSVVKDKEGKEVATLVKGAGAFKEVTNPAGGNRKAYKKLVGETDKTYVDDDRDVKTRRFAYVEKSVFQLMEFFRGEQLTGRFQRFHAEMGEAATGANVLAIKGELKKKLKLDATTADLAKLAVLHQWMGSGLQQRGLSLTSTPRPDAVFGNAGESFKSGDGTRITIDLAKVPKDVKLVNHYAYGGVTRIVPEWVGEKFKKPAYNYRASVIKNRELYLERLDPKWVVAIEVHGMALKPAPPSTTGLDLWTWVREEAGYRSYLAGYRDALNPPKTKHTAAGTPMYVIGEKAGNAYASGYTEGAKEAATTRKNARWNRVEALFKDASKELQRQEDYWLGWIHGVSGVARGSHIPADPPVPVFPTVTPTVAVTPTVTPTVSVVPTTTLPAVTPVVVSADTKGATPVLVGADTKDK